MLEVVMPTELKVGDCVPGLSEPGPKITAIDDSVMDPKYGEQIPLHFEGEEEPRLIPIESSIMVWRPDAS